RRLRSESWRLFSVKATFPPPLLAETRKLLHMNCENTVELLCSNDHPDIAFMVRELAYPASFKDLEFLIPYNWQPEMDEPKRVQELRERKIWGLFATDAFGLGMDVGNIEIIIQDGVTCDFLTFMQRFDLTACRPGFQGFGILFVEKRIL
ncbi:hypothetical protein AN958_09691, partial [Leucoagaricus sp. SymC.cos]